MDVGDGRKSVVHERFANDSGGEFRKVNGRGPRKEGEGAEYAKEERVLSVRG